MPPTQDDIAIFPLSTVLYPDGRLPLRLFEPRYLEMAQRCLAEHAAFGVCLILDGHEAGAPAVPHAVGCSARIVECEAPALGTLKVLARGETGFRIRERYVERDGLVRALVDWMPSPPARPVPDAYELAPALLQSLIDEVGLAMMPMPHRLDDAGWVAHRLAELLPMALAAKQRVLECIDPVEKLEVVMRQLRHMGLPPAP